MALLLKRLELAKEADIAISVHRDTRPLPLSRRTYGPWQFVTLWIVTGSFNVSGWTAGSSLIALGLNVWQAMIVVIIANIFMGFVCVAGGAPGATWGIGFPFWMRSIFGTRGWLFPMAIRVFLSFIWTATNTWYGGQCLKVLLNAIAPSFNSIGGSLANGTMTTADFVAYLLFILLCLPLMWFSPERYKVPFLISSSCVVPTVFVLMIWSVAKAGGGGSLVEDASSVSGVGQALGSKLAWAFVAGITATMGTNATHMFSQSDYTRYARKPGDQVLAQLIMVPLGSTFVAMVGILCTSCAAQLFHTSTLLWQPYAFLTALQTHYGASASSRAATAFASIAFIFSQFGIVVASNAVVAGIDLAALLPRYFNIRRGGYFTIACAVLLNPWQLLNSATSVLTVVGGFAVFLGPFMGVMFSDYFIIRKQKLKLSALYVESLDERNGAYWYDHGFNWRAFAAWIAGVWLLMPGFVEKIVQPKVVWTGWTQLYWMAWLVGCVVAGTVYLILDAIFPMKVRGVVDDTDVFCIYDEPYESTGPSLDSMVRHDKGLEIVEVKALHTF